MVLRHERLATKLFTDLGSELGSKLGTELGTRDGGCSGISDSGNAGGGVKAWGFTPVGES